jgi:N-acylglucosamine 2-epimerase
MKLWWPHSEALYTTLLFYVLTEDEKWLNYYKQMDHYIFNTFPNEDKQIGEWIQIRNREGNPEEKVVALPVKDPFHIIRNFVCIIRLLGEGHAAR